MAGKGKRILSGIIAVTLVSSCFSACFKPSEDTKTTIQTSAVQTTSTYGDTSTTTTDSSSSSVSGDDTTSLQTTIPNSEETFSQSSNNSSNSSNTSSTLSQNTSSNSQISGVQTSGATDSGVTTPKSTTTSLMSSGTNKKTSTIKSSNTKLTTTTVTTKTKSTTTSSKTTTTSKKTNKTQSTTTTTDNNYKFTPTEVDNATVFLNGLSQKERKITEKIINAIKGFKNEIDFSSEKPTQEQVKNALTIATMICVEESYVSRQYSISVDESTGKVSTLKLVYTKTSKEFKTQKSQLEKVCQEIIDGCDATSDYEVIKYIHDEIVKRCTYDGQSENSVTAYGCLVENKAVCEGYAKAFLYLCSKFGFECIPVTGVSARIGQDPEGHMWNKVKLDGKWYNVDVTWDDPIMRSGASYEDYISYDYYFLSDSVLQKTHTVNELSGYTYPVANDDSRNYFKTYGLSFKTKNEAVNNIQKIVNNAVSNNEHYVSIQVANSTEFGKLTDYLFGSSTQEKQIFKILETAKQQTSNSKFVKNRYSKISNDYNYIITLILSYE